MMILGFILLIALILFFTNGFGNFSQNVKGYFSKSNVDAIVKACNVLADSNNEYGFCCEKKEVVYLENGNSRKADFSCSELVDKAFINNKIKNIPCEVECSFSPLTGRASAVPA